MRPYYTRGTIGATHEQYVKASNKQGFREDMNAAIARGYITEDESLNLLRLYHSKGMDEADKEFLRIMKSRGYKG